MTDVLTPAQRSHNMARIRGRDTGPELKFRKALHSEGLRYRLHDRRLPGSPDLVLPKFRAAVFVHGCFWHRHRHCRHATVPAVRREFWKAKFRGNVLRDERTTGCLLALGWRVAIIWECGLTGPRREATVRAFLHWLGGDDPAYQSPLVF